MSAREHCWFRIVGLAVIAAVEFAPHLERQWHEKRAQAVVMTQRGTTAPSLVRGALH
jgi:hypothetical protein